MAGGDVSTAFKAYILVVLTLNATCYILLIHFTRARDGPRYSSTTTVLLSEVSKLFISLLILTKQHKGPVGMVRDVYRNVLCNVSDSAKMAVPSVIYAIQNNLAFYALTYVDAATYQVTYQLKIITTALFMVAMLGKHLSRTQWSAIFLLFMGVALVQVESVDTSNGVKFNARGLMAIIGSCLCSGFAGVYFEKVLKGSETSLWIRNVQMYICGIISASLGVLLTDYKSIWENGFLYGYDILVYVIIGMASIGGLYTSIVVKYLDNIIKGFSTSVSIILAALVSFFLLNKSFGLYYMLGTSLVILAVYFYSLPKKPDSVPTSNGMIRPKETV